VSMSTVVIVTFDPRHSNEAQLRSLINHSARAKEKKAFVVVHAKQDLDALERSLGIQRSALVIDGKTINCVRFTMDSVTVTHVCVSDAFPVVQEFLKLNFDIKSSSSLLLAVSTAAKRISREFVYGAIGEVVTINDLSGSTNDFLFDMRFNGLPIAWVSIVCAPQVNTFPHTVLTFPVQKPVKTPSGEFKMMTRKAYSIRIDIPGLRADSLARLKDVLQWGKALRFAGDDRSGSIVLTIEFTATLTIHSGPEVAEGLAPGFALKPGGEINTVGGTSQLRDALEKEVQISILTNIQTASQDSVGIMYKDGILCLTVTE